MADGYYVVGEPGSVFPSGWNISNAQLMTANGTTWTWTKTPVSLAADATIAFKVKHKSGNAETWIPSAGGNITVSPQFGAGNYTLAVNYVEGQDVPTATLTPLFFVAPVLSLGDGTYDRNQSVTITAGTGTIYYTTDGSDPTDSETHIAYNGPISVAGEGEHVIKAVAVDGNNVSDVVTGTYVIKYQNIYLFGSVGKAHAWVFNYNNPELVTSDGVNYSGVANVNVMPDYTDRGGSAALFMLTTGFPDGSVVDEGNNLWNATKPYMIGTTSGNNFWIDGTTSYLDTWVDAAPVGQSDKGWTIIPANGNGTPYEFFYNRETNKFKIAPFDGPTIYVYDYTRPYIYVEDRDGKPFDGVQPGNPIQILDETVGGHSGLSTAGDGTGDGNGTLGWYKFAVPVHLANCPVKFQFHHNGDKRVIDSEMYETSGDAYYYWDGAEYKPIAKADAAKLRRIVAHVRVQGTTVPTCDNQPMNGPSSFYGQMYYWMAVTTYQESQESFKFIISDGSHSCTVDAKSDFYIELGKNGYQPISEQELEHRLANKTGRGTIIHLLKNKNTPTNQGDYVLGIDTEISTNGTLYNSTNVGVTWWGNSITSPWAGTESWHNDQNTISNYNYSRFLYAESGKDGNPDVYTITAENGTEWYTWYSDRSTATIKFGYGTPKERYPNYLTGGEGAPENPENVYKFYANYESPQTQQTAGELWYVWTPDFNAELNEVSQNQNNGELIDVTRTYESRAKQKALCSTFRDGNYVYYTDIKGWGDDNVYCYAWTVPGLEWPGVKMVKVGYDDEGHPVYLADLSNYDVTAAATGGIIFNNGKEDLATDKRQTGDLPFENHGCYDYLGLLYRIGGNADVIENEPNDNPASLTLIGVWYSRVKGTLFAKTENDYNNKSVNGYGYTDYAKSTDLQSDSYDQSYWVEIHPSKDGLVNASMLQGLIDEKFTLYGKKISSVNPAFEAISVTYLEDVYDYMPNKFTPAHFMGMYQQCSNGVNYFFVEPKPNEFVTMMRAIFVDRDDATQTTSDGYNRFIMNKVTGLKGSFEVDWSYHDKNYPDGELVDGGVAPELYNLTGYENWLAIVKVKESTVATTSDSAPRRPLDVNEPFDPSAYDTSVAPSATYTVYPICINDSMITAIERVNGGKGELLRTRYYNLMGVESASPFDGVNIVVKEYSDGSRVTTKVIR